MSLSLCDKDTNQISIFIVTDDDISSDFKKFLWQSSTSVGPGLKFAFLTMHWSEGIALFAWVK